MKQPIPLDAVTGELFSLSNTLEQRLVQLAPSGNTFLHYCSLDAFYSIMDSGRLRYTSAKSTNDPSEFYFGQKVLSKTLGELPDRIGGAQGKLLHGIEEQLRARQFRAFVFCMSEASEEEVSVGELSQWRLYGSDGRGVALVMRSTKENDLLQKLGSIPRRVVYGETDGDGLIADLVFDFVKQACDLSPDCSKYILDNLQAFQQYVLNVVYWVPSVIKHKAYEHEREVRLVRGDVGAHAGNPLVFFDKGGIRRPAIELNISELVGAEPNQRHESPIEAVIIGPSGDQAAIEDSLRYFLEARNWGVEVRRSDIPYRAV